MSKSQIHFIPHQLGLAQHHINKLISGKPVNISLPMMGSGAGDVVIHLMPQNARKLLNAYKKGKGMRLTMHPHEIEESMMNGRGFFSTLKKGIKSVGKKLYDTGKEFLSSPTAKHIGKNVIEHGAEAIGTAIGAYTGNPVMGSMIGHSLGKAGAEAIDKGGVKHGLKSLKNDAHAIALEALDENIQKLPPAYRKSAELALAGEYPNAVSNIVEHEYNKYSGGYGIKGRGRGRPKGTHPKKGTEEMREKMARLRAMRKTKATTGGKINIGKTLRNAFDPNKNGVAKAFKSVEKPLASSLIHTGIPGVLGAVGDVVGGPVGGVSGSVLGSMIANKVGKQTGLGIKRPRGRPRKGGAVIPLSQAYNRALRLNYGGLTLNNETTANAPVSSFNVNPRVRPSPSEMTLSTYQRMDSPAMNPFIPTSYTQMGGTSSGYGGKGLYGRGLYGP